MHGYDLGDPDATPSGQSEENAVFYRAQAKQWMYQKSAIRQNVTVGSRFHVGAGSRIWAPRALTIGSDVYVGRYCTIEADGVIGDFCLIANNVGVVGRRDHDYTRLGTGMSRTTWVGDEPDLLSSPFAIEDDVWIGFGAIVLSGVHIGCGSVIAAGSLVRDDIPANVLAAGSPARAIRQRFDPADFALHVEALKRQKRDPLDTRRR